MHNKQLWMIVGGNGAGKSKFYELFLEHLGLPFINADILAKEIYPEDPEGRSLDAAKLAREQCNHMIHTGRSFCFETVYSHSSKIDFVAKAKSLGYFVVMVVIHLDGTSLNQARVAERIEEGGHSVPWGKIVSRVPRMLENVRRSIQLCDLVQAYDNSSYDHPYRRVFTIRNYGANNTYEKHLTSMPDWAENLLNIGE